MARQLMDIQTVVVGGGPVASLLVLKTRDPQSDGSILRLPIKVGFFEAASISEGVARASGERPLSHDLLQSVIKRLGATVQNVVIADVNDSIFYARISLLDVEGVPIHIDARPSDAVALAVRAHCPIYAEDHVLEVAALPDFDAVEEAEKEQSLALFHDFVEHISPEDFLGEEG